MKKIKLVVFDMAGTTVRDDSEVEDCFYRAAVQSGLPASKQRIKDMQGLPKLIVVETLWDETIGKNHPEFENKVLETYALFKSILEDHYLTHPVQPTAGALETFAWLRSQGIKIALTTGFYRQVTNIILHRLGWDQGLDQNYRGKQHSIIDLSLTPDETGRGRPYPDMILKAMEILGIEDSKTVIKIGDTPSDLQAGKAANCLLSLAVTNGTHSREALARFENDGLLNSLFELEQVLAES